MSSSSCWVDSGPSTAQSSFEDQEIQIPTVMGRMPRQIANTTTIVDTKVNTQPAMAICRTEGVLGEDRGRSRPLSPGNLARGRQAALFATMYSAVAGFRDEDYHLGLHPEGAKFSQWPAVQQKTASRLTGATCDGEESR